MANADGYVLPKPGIPKTLGILSVIFGVLMVLYGLCLTGAMVAAPAALQAIEKTVKEVQATQEAQQQAQLKSLDDQEKAATTEEQKKAIRQQRDMTIASAPKMPAVDMSGATDQLKDPVVMGYTYLTYISGAILSMILLVAGIGLIRLTSWGRSLGVAWAGLQIAQLVLLTGISLLYVQPVARVNAEKMLAKMEADAKAPNAAPGVVEGARIARAMSGSGMATVTALAFLIGGSIYPVIMLVLLNNPGARAACQGPKTQGPADF